MTCSESAATAKLLASIDEGEPGAVNDLLSAHRKYLRRLIEVRLDPQLRGRIDPSDVVQETLVVASRRIKEFLHERPMSFRLWLRRRALERLVEQRRFHRRQKRNVAKEIVLSDASSLAIAEVLFRDRDHESMRAIRQELLEQVREAMTDLSETDREILLLRHGEELTNAETAEVLAIEPKAASARYGRAIMRLTAQLRRLGI